MQDISIRTAVAVQNFFHRLHDEQRGQAAVEYGGILAVIALIFLAIFGLNLEDDIEKAVKNAVGEILTGEKAKD